MVALVWMMRLTSVSCLYAGLLRFCAFRRLSDQLRLNHFSPTLLSRDNPDPFFRSAREASKRKIVLNVCGSVLVWCRVRLPKDNWSNRSVTAVPVNMGGSDSYNAHQI